MYSVLDKLKEIDWDFADYNSSQYPIEMNSLHWYPATFVPQIPAYLIQLLSEQGDVVLDPFSGSGTTGIEALRLNRKFICNDNNPVAIDILEAKTSALKKQFKFMNDSESIMNLEGEVSLYIERNGLDKEILRWFHEETLRELLAVYEDIIKESDNQVKKIKQCAFSSILNKVCSQKRHFTYITDGCYPSVDELKYIPAIDKYNLQLENISEAARDFNRQFASSYDKGNLVELINNSEIKNGDARDLSWIKDNSVDLIITSPPYICVNDYIRSMRLTNLFFPKEKMKEKVATEIGARRERAKKAEAVCNAFYMDMDKVGSHLMRVLKPEKYLCLVMGQGSGKVTENQNSVERIKRMFEEQYSFELLTRMTRKIRFRRIQLGGVKDEEILIFQLRKD